jgi:hypothetical protein
MSLPEQLQQSDRLDPLVWKITSVAVIGSFLSQLDATVVNVSLSTLAVELYSSLTAIQWVTSGAFGLRPEQILFAAFAGWDAAGAKSFGYPTFWVNRQNQPAEQLGVASDATGGNLNDLAAFLVA